MAVLHHYWWHSEITDKDEKRQDLKQSAMYYQSHFEFVLECLFSKSGQFPFLSSSFPFRKSNRNDGI